MNYVALIIAMLSIGACATSSTPSSSVDGGSLLDATLALEMQDRRRDPTQDLVTPGDRTRVHSTVGSAVLTVSTTRFPRPPIQGSVTRPGSTLAV